MVIRSGGIDLELCRCDRYMSAYSNAVWTNGLARDVKDELLYDLV